MIRKFYGVELIWSCLDASWYSEFIWKCLDLMFCCCSFVWLILLSWDSCESSLIRPRFSDLQVLIIEFSCSEVVGMRLDVMFWWISATPSLFDCVLVRCFDIFDDPHLLDGFQLLRVRLNVSWSDAFDISVILILFDGYQLLGVRLDVSWFLLVILKFWWISTTRNSLQCISDALMNLNHLLDFSSLRVHLDVSWSFLNSFNDSQLLDGFGFGLLGIRLNAS